LTQTVLLNDRLRNTERIYAAADGFNCLFDRTILSSLRLCSFMVRVREFSALSYDRTREDGH
jgi:hypothetical protein